MSRPAGFRHTPETIRRMSKAKLGVLNPNYGQDRRGSLNRNWRGGRRYCEGYVLVYCPEHPYCDSDNCVSEHRLVLERKLGRYLLPSEVSHHLNGVKTDNRPENLEVYDGHSHHMKEHTLWRKRNDKGQFLATA